MDFILWDVHKLQIETTPLVRLKNDKFLIQLHKKLIQVSTRVSRILFCALSQIIRTLVTSTKIQNLTVHKIDEKLQKIFDTQKYTPKWSSVPVPKYRPQNMKNFRCLFDNAPQRMALKLHDNFPVSYYHWKQLMKQPIIGHIVKEEPKRLSLWFFGFLLHLAIMFRRSGYREAQYDWVDTPWYRAVTHYCSYRMTNVWKIIMVPPHNLPTIKDSADIMIDIIQPTSTDQAIVCIYFCICFLIFFCFWFGVNK